MLKKENKKKQAELVSQKKIDDPKESGNKKFKAGKFSSTVKLYTEAIGLCGPKHPNANNLQQQVCSFHSAGKV